MYKEALELTTIFAAFDYFAYEATMFIIFYNESKKDRNLFEIADEVIFRPLRSIREIGELESRLDVKE